MFNQYPMYAEGAALKSPEACKPDPEDMLQRAKKRVEECDRAEKMIMELAEMPVDICFGQNNGDALASALGSIALSRYRAKKEEEYWLKEIDK